MNSNKNNKEAKSNLLPIYIKNHSVGKVHSKYNNGLNVQFDDFLVYISSIGTPLAAFGLNIEDKKLKQILNSARIDDMVINKCNKLIFYSIYGAITIDYKNVKQVDLKLPKVKCSISELSITNLYKYLSNIEFEKFIGINLDKITCKYVDLLLNSNKSDLNVNSAIIRFFTGRGKGLTPSGDDILLGFTLVLMIFDKLDTWIKTIKSWDTKNSTTMISVAYLDALLLGYASEQLIQLVKMIDSIDIYIIEETIREVQSFGHTSGNDTLFGFFLGLRFLINAYNFVGVSDSNFSHQIMD